MGSALRSNVTWLADDSPLLGCVKCDYGRDLGTLDELRGVLCRHPEVARLPRLMPTEIARQFGGSCGKEAKYLTINGVEL